MEDSCGPRKPIRPTAGIKIATSFSDGQESTGHVHPIHLPHLVVGKILENLSCEDLRRCSLVNKAWNHEARRLLREKHECALTVDLDMKSAKEILEFFGTTLTIGLPLSYVQLAIKKKDNSTRQQGFTMWPPSKELQLAEIAVRDFVRRTGPFRVVQLDFRCDTELSFEVWFTRNVLAEVQNTVNALKIKNFDGCHLFYNVRRLPELKKLEVDVEAEIQLPDVVSFQNFLNYPVKLETVGCLPARWLQVLEKLPPIRKLQLVKQFTCANMDQYRGEAEKFAALEPKLEKLFIPRKLNYITYEPGVTSSISMSLLLSSQTSLIELQATYEMLQQLRRERPFTSFVNLRHLIVDIPWDMGSYGLDRSDTITALCPRLDKLVIKREIQPPLDFDDHYDSFYG